MYNSIREHLNAKGIVQDREHRLVRSAIEIAYVVGETVYSLVRIRKERLSDFRSSPGRPECLDMVKLSSEQLESMLSLAIDTMKSRRLQRL